MAILRKKICFVCTAEFAVTAFLLNHLKVLSTEYDVTVITNTSNPLFLSERDINATVIPLAISRNIHLFLDFLALVQMIKIFYQQRFSAVHSVTPKAGLLAMLAAWVVRAPLRVHTFTGQVWVTSTGYKRFLLKWIDCLIASLTTHNIIDSPSQRQFLIGEGVLTAIKSQAFAKGSISGVDIAKFKPAPHRRQSIRQQLNIANNTILFLFLGRLTKDKGVLDLVQAFSGLSDSGTYLLFVGPDEQNMRYEITCMTEKRGQSVGFVGYTQNPQDYMAAADVFCLPSYREGFGSVVIEAAAVGIPAIASNIYGVSDAVVDGETGLLHAPHDIASIHKCMQVFITNRELRLKLGRQAKLRAVQDFNSNLITEKWVSFYRESLH